MKICHTGSRKASRHVDVCGYFIEFWYQLSVTSIRNYQTANLFGTVSLSP